MITFHPCDTIKSADNKVNLVMHPSHLGASDDDDGLLIVIRALSMKHAEAGEWADKYGTNYEDDTIMIQRFCWCDSENCPQCGDVSVRPEIGFTPVGRDYQIAANFWHKPSGFKCCWYKYIGRDMEFSASEIPAEQWKQIIGLVTDDDLRRVVDSAQKANEDFAAMIASVNTGNFEDMLQEDFDEPKDAF